MIGGGEGEGLTGSLCAGERQEARAEEDNAKLHGIWLGNTNKAMAELSNIK